MQRTAIATAQFMQQIDTQQIKCSTYQNLRGIGL